MVKNSDEKNNHTGFSLVELMVVLAIFAIVMSIILNDAPKFRDKTSLDLVSQNIALNIRGAQVFSIGTKIIENDAPQSFGIHLNSGEQSNFILFSNSNSSDDFYSGGSFPTQCPSEGDECLELYRLRGAIIEKICFDDVCVDDDDNRLIEILYTRPQSEANFCVRTNYVSSSCDNSPSSVRLYITNTRGSERRLITAWKNGQITVETPPDDQ